MNTETAFDRLLELVKADLPDLEANSILKNEDGTFSVFGKFTISETNNKFFTVKKYDNFEAEFTTLKSAISWCVAEKYNQSKLSNSIKILEQERCRLLCDIGARSQLFKKFKNLEQKKVVELKLTTKKDRLKQIDTQITKCINSAKYWQIQGFNNETARTGRSPSQRTNY